MHYRRLLNRAERNSHNYTTSEAVQITIIIWMNRKKWKQPRSSLRYNTPAPTLSFPIFVWIFVGEHFYFFLQQCAVSITAKLGLQGSLHIFGYFVTRSLTTNVDMTVSSIPSCLPMLLTNSWIEGTGNLPQPHMRSITMTFINKLLIGVT